jgi:hypothetical protein
MTPEPLMPVSAPIFAHAMWRSGSTYLASRFAASERYLMFYEPCHEGIGRKPSRARTRDRSRDRQLRHPGLDGGYFGAYDQLDPVSQRPLTAFFAPDISLRTVYATASDATVRYLEALNRCAQSQGKTAFFGFCRSGTQGAAAQARLSGRGLHLWREPRAQFTSYDWPANDYFMTGTLLQLAHSRRHAGLARRFAPGALASPLLRLALLLPDRHARTQYRLARPVARQLTAEQSYALFYLSWLLSNHAGRSAAQLSFSLSGLAADAGLRARVEAEFGIRFDDLRATPDRHAPGISYDAIEADVAGALSAETGTPLRLPR